MYRDPRDPPHRSRFRRRAGYGLNGYGLNWCGSFAVWLVCTTGLAEDHHEWTPFQPIQQPAVPAVDDHRWSGNPIDAFIKRSLDGERLRVAPRADKGTLARRAYLDLLGLLPTPDQVDAFVQDSSADAFDRLVDQLLASPHYGERWGRHWLDTVRYADSGGYEFDFDYPNAWRYRDYVVRAFNDDKPFNQFVLEQLAGDELDEVNFDSLIATGFSRVGPTVGYREKDNPQYRYEYLDDLIATTSQAFMGLTVQCARCHDHKFDPIEQLDYYRMMAVFFPFVNYDYPLASESEVAKFNDRKRAIELQVGPLKSEVAKIEAPARKEAFAAKLKSFSEDIRLAVETPESERSQGQQLLAAQVISIGVDAASVRARLSREDRERIAELRKEIAALEQQMPEPLPLAMGIRDGDYRFAPDGPGDELLPGKGNREFYDFEGTYLPRRGATYQPPVTHFLPNGSHLEKDEVVEAGFPAFLCTPDTPTTRLPDNDHITSGRRRALAEWLIDERHPLTARVLVNRVWQHHFGSGIVSTPNNFGFLGQEPSHPALLDWLAAEFVRRGWSIKQLHRLIMSSETYQLASEYHDASNAEIDPTNRYLYRFPMRRLEAEAIRDMVLACAGNLRSDVGGEPFFPVVPESVRFTEYYGRWDVNSEGPELWRRGLYSYYRRGLRYPMFEVFDQPDPNVSCERRDVSTVPTQALCMLNNSFVLEQARQFAHRIAAESAAESESESRIRLIYRIALGRSPSDSELDMNLEFLRNQRGNHGASGNLSEVEASFEALVDLCNVVMNLNEFVYLR